MNFNNNQIKIIESLIEERLYYLKENIFYIKNNHSLENIHESRNELIKASDELKNLIELKSYILSNQELTECI
tara:strand:- start:237 stop:455 length:219 start_codon:yes stop_codon:yes gene_type:complete